MIANRLNLWIVALGLASCRGVNPYCEGDGLCLPYRATEHSCVEFIEIPDMRSVCLGAMNHATVGLLINEDGGCIHLGHGGIRPLGWRRAPPDHWCRTTMPPTEGCCPLYRGVFDCWEGKATCDDMVWAEWWRRS